MSCNRLLEFDVLSFSSCACPSLSPISIMPRCCRAVSQPCCGKKHLRPKSLSSMMRRSMIASASSKDFSSSMNQSNLFDHPANRGVPTALNTGLAAASGDLVYFAAADDFVLPGFFSVASDALRAYCSGRLFLLMGGHRRSKLQDHRLSSVCLPLEGGPLRLGGNRHTRELGQRQLGGRSKRDLSPRSACRARWFRRIAGVVF